MNEELIRLKFSDKTTQWFPFSTMSGEVRTEGLTVIVDDIVLNNTMSGVANYELADGTALTFPLAISGQKVTFPMTTQLVRDGEVKLQLEIYDGNNVYKSAVYKYIVNKSLGYVTITNEEQQLIQSIVIEENKRVTNENTRLENESTRVSSEIVRIENENVRIENENARVSSEIVRIENENVRELSEEERVSSETVRIENENARVSSEIVRIENENVRELSEEERVSSETVRIENEETRVSNENERIANENARKSAETNRVASITDIEKRFASLTTAQQQQAEVADARMDTHGTVHANLKTRLDEDFKELASKIPTDVAMNGYESVTTNDTLSGEVSSAVLSGNTLVNVWQPKTASDFTSLGGTFSSGIVTLVGNATLNYRNAFLKNDGRIKSNTTYTLGVEIIEVIGVFPDKFQINYERPLGYADTSALLGTYAADVKVGLHIAKVTSAIATDVNTYPVSMRTTFGNFAVGNSVKLRCFILEGDHTDKPLEFFEGLKSAEVAEIGTHGVNLVDNDTIENVSFNHADGTEISDSIFASSRKFYRIKPETNYQGVTESHAYLLAWFFYDENKNFISSLNDSPVATSPKGARFMRLRRNKTFHKTTSVYEVTPNTPTEYVPYQESKVTLPSPITLRSLPNGVADTYDLDTQILTRRCGEVVLNGSESGWGIYASTSEFFAMYRPFPDAVNFSGPYDKYHVSNFVKDFPYQASKEGFGGNTSKNAYVSIAKSKLATPDVAGFKAWLTANPTTVVYQLATPTTEYIENNGQLRSYDSQTTVFANSIVPVKISGNIPVNYASTLANLALQARNLQIENTALIEQAESLSEQLNIAEQTNNFQDELIDVSLMATDELYVMLEPLLENVAQPMSATNTQKVSDETTKNTQDSSQDTTKQTQGGNAMVDAYVAMVIRGLKTIDEVPARYREEVRRILAELDK